jgi:hypothetical protein
MRRLLSVTALALVLGAQVGCVSTCDCTDAPPVMVLTTGLGDAAAVTTCLGDDCRELERAGAELFWGFDEALSSDRVRVRVEVRNSSGDVLQTFDKGRHPRNSCCGRYITVQYDGDELGWLDY